MTTLTTGQAAAAMGLTQQAINNRIRCGLMAATFDGRMWRIEPDEVQRAMREQPPLGRLGDVAYRTECKERLRDLAEYHGMPMVEVVEALVQREWQTVIGGQNDQA
jgi:excisionase family DNA binding protein